MTNQQILEGKVAKYTIEERNLLIHYYTRADACEHDSDFFELVTEYAEHVSRGVGNAMSIVRDETKHGNDLTERVSLRLKRIIDEGNVAMMRSVQVKLYAKYGVPLVIKNCPGCWDNTKLHLQHKVGTPTTQEEMDIARAEAWKKAGIVMTWMVEE